MSALFLTRFAELRPGLKRLLCACALTALFAVVHLLAHLVRFDGRLHAALANHLAEGVLLSVAIKTPIFAAFRLLRGWFRHLTFHDLVTLAKAASVASLLLVAVCQLAFKHYMPPRSVLLLDWALTILFVGGLRSLVRVVQEYGTLSFGSGSPQTPVLIAGADNSAEALLRAIRRDAELNYRVVGFVTDDARMTGSQIGGVPVVTSIELACEYAHQHAIDEILITADALSGRDLRALVERGRERGIGVRVLPSLQQLLSGNVALRPRAVSIEDLLRRDPVQLDTAGLEEWIRDRVVLVTGSAGSIGSEICRQILRFGPRKLVAVDRSENGQFFLDRELQQLAAETDIEICLADTLDGLRMSTLFREHAPEIVFHAAAYKHVPLMEAHPGEAVKNICVATRLVADLAHQHGVSSFVLISTDKAVEPTSVMGVCKRVAELYVQSLAGASDCRFVTVRFGNVLDSAGSVVPIFREQIARGGPVTVTHPDMRRYFMTIPEASQLVIQAGAIGNGGEIFVLDMGEPVNIADLARDLIRYSGLRPDVDIDIEYVGMRPGEKLVEELHFHDEPQYPTIHPKIVVAACRAAGRNDIRTALSRLADLATMSPDEVPAELEQIVPEYRPHGERLIETAPQLLRRSA
ncbi:MAG: polysaccharide biosynthesis protein [Planctomycetaceae bacterium]|nr:polysaccharide biosynthesis protein [Planctomycetaceae bacterium]